MPLTNIIINTIKTGGPLSFHQFMEMALYYPQLGYYTRQGDKIGRNGDFYTSSNLTPVFGAMVGRQVEEMWQYLGKKPFTFVEYGAGTGALCRHVLDYLQQNEKLYRELSYCIIEKSPSLRDLQQQIPCDKLRWLDDISEISGFNGCVFSNEVVDNFAVHQVVMRDELMEVLVDYDNGFKELYVPAGEALKDYLLQLGIALPKDHRTEINLEATRWIAGIAAALHKGWVITIDYGFMSEELYSKRRSCGTLMCYNRHHLSDDPYSDIGSKDITAHINFSALCYWGHQHGLGFKGFTNQANFLLALGFKEHLRRIGEKDPNQVQAAMREASLTRLLLLDMGMKFKVLVQHKGMGGKKLKGLCCAEQQGRRVNLYGKPA